MACPPLYLFSPFHVWERVRWVMQSLYNIVTPAKFLPLKKQKGNFQAVGSYRYGSDGRRIRSGNLRIFILQQIHSWSR